MKMKLFAAAVMVFTLGSIQAQQLEKCATHRAMDQVFKVFPELKENYEMYELMRNSEVIPEGAAAKTQSEYVIPVVFHILHEYGTENILDAQVYDAMEIINREFNAADPDSVDLVPEFANLNGNARITFKLASIDPFGNCTNGIEHIYTHETRVGDMYSKIHQWNRSQYMNIWVVDVVGVPGAAAYATFPASTDGSGFWLDGLLSAHNYVGSIGTSNPGSESVLTHEIGHWLGLQHTFGNSDLINNGPTICNDDGISDTPDTRGHLHCAFSYPDQWIDCDTSNGGVVEDLQNYMDYSYCDRHFTPGQCQAMRYTLEGIAGQRDFLWKDSTLIATGVMNLQTPQDPNNPLTVPLCRPVADFYSDKQTVCMGSNVTFHDRSWNAVVESREWIFQDGTPSTSTSATANVSFNSPGWKKVTLTVTNAEGSDTREESHYIYVSPDWPENYGPTTFNMETTSTYGKGTDFFIVQNPEENHGKFGVISNYGYGGSKAFKLQTYLDNANADPYTEAYFYNDRLGYSLDNLITPSMDLRNTSNITVTFKYAYATNATIETDIDEKLRVYSTRNCGETWAPRVLTVDGNTVGSTLTGNNLVTAGYASNADFNPTNDLMWKEASFTYTATTDDRLTRFKFEFEATDLSSNLFIDDINITGVLGIEDPEIMNLELIVFPNPSKGEAIQVSYEAQELPTEFTLRDVNGKVVSYQYVETTNSSVNITLENTNDLPGACYFLEVKTGDYSTTKKVVVM